MKFWNWMLVVILAYGTLPCPAGDVPLGVSADVKVPDFELKDFRGKVHRLSERADDQIIVLVFFGTECPLAKLYGPRLARLAAEFTPKGVAFFGINSNSQDSVTEIAAYARIHQIEFPLLKDLNNQLADTVGAERTPEVFVLDRERVIRYRGRIDDQLGVGYARDKTHQEFLKNALEDLLAGRPVGVSSTEPQGCFIGKVRAVSPDAMVTYSKHIAPIFQRHCVECHRDGEIGPFALTQYQEVAGWSETIEEVITQNRMPPWHADPQHGQFANERRLSDEEKSLVREWVRAGAPEGDPTDLPSPREYIEGWQLPREPDQVIAIQDKPFSVPAEGEVKYQYFRVNPNFTEDKWVSAAQLVPGNRAVVHHILVFALPTEGVRDRLQELEGGRQGFLVGYVPGHVARPLPPGMAKRVPAGSQLLFQIHYTPNGSPQLDQSKLGLIFADPTSVTHEVRTMSASARRLEIPPEVANHKIEATTPRAVGECDLLNLMPHMHLRGKSFLYEAIYPDGRTEILLDVPHYDFHWQTAYRLAEPKHLPAGTRIHCVARYDNSEGNLNNPDPKRTVRWGEQTWDEMMIGYFDVAIPVEEAQREHERETADRQAASENRLQLLMQQLDRDGDGRLVPGEVPDRFRAMFERLDGDKSGGLDRDELRRVLDFLPGVR